MNTVTTINLAGTAFQIEDPGYATLKRYLDDAKAALSGNPDEAEITGDIERAIADKCRRYVSAHKNVITAAEAEAIVAEMGPVAGDASEAPTGATAKPKRLYRVIEGEWLGGVATGLAAYLDIDVTLVRIVIVALTVVTSGAFALAYFLAWMIIPPAETAEQRAAASGAPFNAQDILNRARAEYARFEARHGADWKRQWRDWKRDMKRQHEEHKRWERDAAKWRAYHHQGPNWIGELFAIIAFSFFAWYGYHHFPALHDFMDACWNLLNRVVNIITNALVNR
jgi:phage shock protein PspC (stress-responsive transcriptional regulator)